MRSLLLAAALGLGLLSAGGSAAPAAAAPYHAGPAADLAQAATPVHYERHGYRPHYAPPRHHWHRYAPPPPRHSWRHQPRHYYYGAR
ncbi:hypothetical protein QWZ14_18700 [Paeniroseomonas aquatica]|uniref:Uncharacterized protein n=1 Tax=Paeniroseomonas aquatica TaxID=373043 RepID=A0ABT8A9I6_9PROT|nr:hypothetical protein [Paeniroseomonas aquatica]MDN3566406.1 hypothetical protein [Paeniroseomonas aquatica]